MVSVPVTRRHSSSKLSARRTSLFWLIADVTCGSIRVAYSASPEASRGGYLCGAGVDDLSHLAHRQPGFIQEILGQSVRRRGLRGI